MPKTISLYIKAVLPPEAAFEFFSRLLAAKPYLDISFTTEGLHFILETELENINKTFQTLNALATRLENTRKIEKIDFFIAKSSLKEEFTSHLISKNKLANFTLGTSEQSDLIVPKELKFSNRLWQLNEILAKKINSYLNPPLGFEKIKNAKVLILDEQFPITCQIAALQKAKHIVLISSFQEKLASELAKANNNKISIYNNKFLKLEPEITQSWENYFNLIIVNLSAYLSNKYLLKLSKMLSSENGILIITNLTTPSQNSLILRKALKTNLTLLNSMVENNINTLIFEVDKVTKCQIKN